MKNYELIELRKSLGLTQKIAAKLLGISERSFQRYEADDRSMPNYFNIEIVRLTLNKGKKDNE